MKLKHQSNVPYILTKSVLTKYSFLKAMKNSVISDKYRDDDDKDSSFVDIIIFNNSCII